MYKPWEPSGKYAYDNLGIRVAKNVKDLQTLKLIQEKERLKRIWQQ